MAGNKVPVTFISGASPRKNLLGLIAHPDMLLGTDERYTRVFYYLDGKWGRGVEDFHFDSRSMCCTLIPDSEQVRSWWTLGKEGEVVETPVGQAPLISSIATAGVGGPHRHGYLSSLKNVAGSLFACGYGRQVYGLNEGEWGLISDEIVSDQDGCGFFDLDGPSSTELCAVGWRGEIYFYDGKRWTENRSPTTAHLAAVHCVGPDEYWACGNDGTVLKGSKGRWEAIESNWTENFYDIEFFDQRVFCVSSSGVFEVVDRTVVKVDLPFDTELTTHTLCSNKDQLWSIGAKSIFMLENEVWTEIHHPDNQ